jgi:hypothetical protein
MKRLLILFFTVLSSSTFAQLVNETVDFNNYVSSLNNDFTNFFDNGTGLTQIQTNGITGGSLQTPMTISWGNDNAYYCSKLKAAEPDSVVVSICFMFDSTLISGINFDRAASIWFNPSADWNHYLIAEANPTGIRAIGYSTVSSGGNFTPVHGSWHKLEAIMKFTNSATGRIDYSVNAWNLGPAGTSMSLLSNVSGNFNDTTLCRDTSITISITGTSFGGAAYLDNFAFNGRLAGNSCITSSISENVIPPVSQFLFHSFTLFLNNGEKISWPVKVYDINGALVKMLFSENEFPVDFKSFGNGIYFVTNEKGLKPFKFIMSK